MSEELTYCSFCDRTNKFSDVFQMIISRETDSVICNVCIELARDIIGEARRNNIVITESPEQEVSE